MAGQDQSVNLGGMLGQIAETTGSMGDAYKPVLKAATKPRGDMNDPAHLNNLAQWASSNGDAQAASMYMNQARQLEAEQKRVADATKMNTATSAYHKARTGGNAQEIADAEEALLATSNATGQDAFARMEAVNQGIRRAEDQARQEKDAAEQAAEKQAVQDFTQQLNGADDEEAIQAVVDSADPTVAPIAQRLATQRLTYLNERTRRAQMDAENAQDVVIDVTIDENLDPKLVAAHKAELEAIEALKENGKVNGTWTPTVRSAIQRRVTKLAENIYREQSRAVATDLAVTNQRRRDYQGKAGRIAMEPPSKQVYEEIEKELKAASKEKDRGDGLIFDSALESDYNSEAVMAEYRRRRMAALDAEYQDVILGDAPDTSSLGPLTGAEAEAEIDAAHAANKDKTREQVAEQLRSLGIIQ